MGCMSSKAGTRYSSATLPPTYAQSTCRQRDYGQPYVGQPGYWQPGCGQQPASFAHPSYAQYSDSAACSDMHAMQGHLVQGQVIAVEKSPSNGSSSTRISTDAPFLELAAPDGSTWRHYVQRGESGVDHSTGFLSGPWAECIASAVVFEHKNRWQQQPEYARDGPVGGVLTAFEATLAAVNDSTSATKLKAAQRLEDASHAAAERGQPTPVHTNCVLPAPSCTQAFQQPACQQPYYEQRDYAQYPYHNQPPYAHQQSSYASPPLAYGQPPYSQQQNAYASPPLAYSQPPYSQQQNARGGNNMGAMALAGLGGLAAGGLVGSALGGGLDGVSETLGGAGQSVMGWAGDAGETVTGWSGDAWNGAEGVFDDIF